MAISNGFDEARVLPALIARKGWVQPTSADFPFTLSGDIITCTSGLPFNYDHGICSPAVLWRLQENNNIAQADFLVYLQSLLQNVVMDSLNAVFKVPQIIEPPKLIFSKNFRTSYLPIPNAGNFCGWQINVAKGDYAVKIDSMALLMSAPCTVTIYVYNDVRVAPLWTGTITVPTGNDQTIVNIDDLVLNYQSDVNKGSVFFVGYYQDEIAAQGVQATDVYLNDWESYYMAGYQAFEATAAFNPAAPASSTFVRDRYYSNYRTHGLNLEMSTYYDYTNTIVRNASQFDRLIGLMMVAKCIEEVMFSQRSNMTQRLTQEQMQLLYEDLEGKIPAFAYSVPMAVNVPYKSGLRNKIEREIWRITQTFKPDDTVITTVPPANDGGRYDLPHWSTQIS